MTTSPFPPRVTFLLLSCLLVVQLVGQSFTVKPAESSITWSATKVTGGHTGEVALRSGTITMLEGVLGTADMTVDMTSITCTDITSEGSNAKLVGHLKSADFFAVDQHALARFKTKKVEGLPSLEGDEVYQVSGDLTIKGITHPVEFTCYVSREGEAVRAEGTLVFDRSKYDIRYGSGSFFDGLGDRMIHDEVSLAFNLLAR